MKTFKYLLMQMFYWACFCAIFSFANPYLSSKGVPVSLFYITDTFETRDVIKAQAYIGTALTLGSILGNYIGAQICQNISIFALLIISTVISMLGTVLIIKCAKK